jgi:iron complex outermembrane recepter protein
MRCSLSIVSRRACAAVALLVTQQVGAQPLPPPGVVAPQAIEHPAATYPESERASMQPADVVLILTIDAAGRVSDATVAVSGGAAFDQAAIAAARAWRFSPALRDGRPVAARIRLGFHFDPPSPAPTAGPVEAADAARAAKPDVQPTPPAEPTSAPASPAAAAPAAQAGAEPATEIVVVGRSHIPSRGVGDYEIPVGNLARVPRSDAASLLRLAPGVFLTNEGGTGHPYQIFLRGFDAREGQDIEFTVDGVPINEVGNPHGNGLSDTHFIIPELVQNLRVVEGPFAPQQGNFAVAGSALYDVGLAEPGFRAQATAGSFNTKRLLLLWRPDGYSDRTFGGAEVFSSDGFGENRASERATAIGGYEVPLGAQSSIRLLGSTYATHYAEAGVLRADDVESGKKPFFGTYDTTQGGDSSRHSLSMTLEGRGTDTRVSQSAFVTLRDFRLRQNLTGFQQDPQQTWQSEHQQRGDLIDQQSSTVTFGGRGSARKHFKVRGLPQELELGYFGRYDRVDATQRRDRAGTTIPYRTDLDLASGLTNVGIHADASLKPLRWVTLRGGLRADYYHYLVTNRCALTSQASFGGDPLDTECFASDRLGYRNPEQTASTSASVIEPRATLLLGAVQGFTFSLSHGRGSRSVDPQYVNQDLKTPFARVAASELGVAFERGFGAVQVEARSVFFQTSVDKDLFFNESEGRNTLSNGTTRTGWAGNARATGRFFDLAGNLTLVRATFDDTHQAIPYAPDVVARVDGALFGDLPLHTWGSLAVGASYVGPRPLPFDELSQTTFLVDLGASLRWRAFTLGLVTTNLLGRHYRLSELNYASDFHSQDYPTLVAARHFVAGEPRAVYGTFAVTLDGGARP